MARETNYPRAPNVRNREGVERSERRDLIALRSLTPWNVCLKYFVPILTIMKSTKVQNPRRKCSTACRDELRSGRVPHTVPYLFFFFNNNTIIHSVKTKIYICNGPRTIITYAHRAPLIDGLGHATWSAT